MLSAFLCIASSLRNKRLKLDENNFKDCPTIVDNELKSLDEIVELTLKAGECREISAYSYSLASQSEITAD
ncbi:hypothetical protein TVAG_142160 [Trichomonas vaginalis G3]|uniref:Uncharacterized protein n=1 Tax=Trichomonas vaginalis (strain ATCC PRA-98 / G3) TaxID=412133 RepID=A2EHH5_TRIV3|nr:hypothetical protein TVAGG3_0775100 [Trichomonas vaginalis G3]EAY07862.1 hypothetical protein TVAG_142160 [Trichomonas vaginalis G3]KAI5514108.1 hypothetical protein TVAGG3_0775100 [Trichomonas vaginalis G3]|eukprot:XP_001320085.1 hypothetical protein [Trichomonas vaginalis G3]